jgi:hypothetical protein
MVDFSAYFGILFVFQPLSRGGLKTANTHKIMEWEFLLRPAVTCLYKELSLTPPLGGSFQC